MLNKGIREFVHFILGRREQMIHEYQVNCQRDYAIYLLHTNLHDHTKGHPHHSKRVAEYKNLLVHPLQSKTDHGISFRDGIKQLSNG